MSDLLTIPNFYQWLFLDLNSYFASVEQEDNPRLRGLPIIVTPSPSDYTCAIAASYEAKKFGIKTGTKIVDAKRLCPQVICVPARHDIYVRYHHKIIEEAAKLIPINKVWSIDEFSSKLPARFHSRDRVTKLVYDLKSLLYRNVGPMIRCSVGIASNSFLAKVASDMMKPDGLVVLDQEYFPHRLFDLKLTDLPGINVRMEYRLAKGNIWTIRDFWNSSPKQMRAIWGSVTGERFWYHLHGYELDAPKTQASMIGHSRVLDPDHRLPDIARLVAARLALKAASRLRRSGFYAGRLGLSVKETAAFYPTDYRADIKNNQEGYYAEHRFATPTDDSFELIAMLNKLWQDMMVRLRPQKLKKLSITLCDLYRGDQITRDLFEREPLAVRGMAVPGRKSAALSRVMDEINAKFGAESLQMGISPKTQAGYVGTKIAFHRIPDIAEFYE